MAKAGGRKRTSARDVARRVLERVDEGAYATLALSGELERADLSPADRALTTELVYGVLKRRLYLDHALALHAERGLSRLDSLTRDVLRLGAYQILFLRIPGHAAVNEAVETIKRLRGERLAGFANALLRALLAAGPPGPETLPADPIERLVITWSLPRPLVKDALRRFGPVQTERFLQALAEPAPLWLRLNTLRGTVEEGLAELAREVPPGTLHPSTRLPEAVRARGHEIFTGPAFAAGWFTAQDLGAQLVAHLVDPASLPEGPLLDACAGVGGKTTHLSALCGDRRPITAADRSLRKLELCAELARRLGCTAVRTLETDLTAEDAPLQAAYAAVLLDAPCSGLGVLRRHPEARWRFDPDRIDELSSLQRRLLATLSRRVLRGGLLVYSVCTYTDEEGPRQIAHFLRETPGFAIEPAPEIPAFAGLRDEQGALRTWPHRDDADAFYAVRLRRID